MCCRERGKWSSFPTLRRLPVVHRADVGVRLGHNRRRLRPCFANTDGIFLAVRTTTTSSSRSDRAPVAAAATAAVAAAVAGSSNSNRGDSGSETGVPLSCRRGEEFCSAGPCRNDSNGCGLGSLTRSQTYAFRAAEVYADRSSCALL